LIGERGVMTDYGRTRVVWPILQTVLLGAILTAVVLLILPVSSEYRQQAEMRQKLTEWGTKHLKQAEEAAAAGELRKAERILEEAVKSDPANLDLRLAHLRYFVTRAAEQPQNVASSELEALEYALGVVAAYDGPDYEPRFAVAQARLQLRREQVADARNTLNNAIEKHPDYVHVYLALADLERSQGRRLEALAAFEKAVQTEPDNLKALNNLGVQYVELERFEDGVAMFLKAVNLEDNSASRLNAGNALVRLGRTGEAVEHLQRAALLSPGSAEIHRQLGNLLVVAKRPEEAARALVTSLAIKPDSQTALTVAGIYLSLKQFDRSLQAFERILQAEPASLDAAYGLAVSLHRLGKTAETQAAAKRYLLQARQVPTGQSERVATMQKLLASLEHSHGTSTPIPGR
jgi:tetratricopeptide (TPR) repeat protein